MLGMSTSTVKRMTLRGELPCVRLSGNVVRYVEAEILEYMARKEAERFRVSQPARRRASVVKPRVAESGRRLSKLEAFEAALAEID